MNFNNLSLVIPWSNRPGLLEMLLHTNSVLNDVLSSAGWTTSIIISSVSGNPSMLADIVTRSRITCTTIHAEAEFFNKSLALNLGVHHATTRFLLLVDADVLLSEEIIRSFLEQAEQGMENTFAVVRQLREKTSDPNTAFRSSAHLEEIRETLLIKCHDGTTACADYVFGPEGLRPTFGQLFLRRNAFVSIDGANSGLRGWGFQDTDLILRLQLKLGLRPIAVGIAQHLTHDNNLRETVTGQTVAYSQRANRASAMSNYMLGHFLGTYSRDCESWKSHLQVNHYASSTDS